MKSPFDPQPTPRRVIVLVSPGIHLLNMAGPVQVFHKASRLGAAYDLSFCATSPTIESAQLLHFAELAPLPGVQASDLILIPGAEIAEELPEQLTDEATRQWLRDCVQCGATLASVCSGVAILGEAGLLHRRRCTTHWDLTAELQARYPTASVQEGVLFVEDPPIISSAGFAAGIDMALWLIERDYGPRFTADLAHHLVLGLRRNGSDQQRSVFLEFRNHLDPSVHLVQDWLIEHPTSTPTLKTLAAVAHTSISTLSRAFKEATGLTPHAYQHVLRMEVAARMLHESNLSIEAISRMTGFGDPRHFRRVWAKQFGYPPSRSRAHIQ